MWPFLQPLRRLGRTVANVGPLRRMVSNGAQQPDRAAPAIAATPAQRVPAAAEPTPSGSVEDTSTHVRLIDETGQNLGIVSTTEAVRLGALRGLTMVEVNSRAVPRVCRLVDRQWGAPKVSGPATGPAATASATTVVATTTATPASARTDRPTRAGSAGREDASSATAESDRKEIRLRAKISPHDLDVKVGKLAGFLSKGHRVKITLQYRPDDATPVELAAMLKSVADRLDDCGSVERDTRPEGRRAISLLMAPSKSKKAAPRSASVIAPAAAGVAGRAVPANSSAAARAPPSVSLENKPKSSLGAPTRK